MKRTVILALGGLLALGGTPIQAQDVLTADPTLPTTRVGTRGATFLTLGVGARAQALAGAYTAMADDISALYWNPAGIAHLEGFAAGFNQAMLYSDLDIGHTFVGAVLPVGLTRLGVSVNMLDSGNMPWTDESFPNPEPFGEDFNPTRSEFSWTSMAIGGHIARPITDRLWFGGALKLVQEGITGAEAEFLAADLGAQFETGLYGLTIGASLTNIGTSGKMQGQELRNRINTGNSEVQEVSRTGFVRVADVELDAEEVELPTAFRFSLLADLIGSASSIISPNPDNALRLAWDLTDAVDTDIQTALGLEYAYRELAFLRLGKRWTNEAQISHDFSRNASIGGGLHLPLGDFGRVSLDYAYTGMGELENIQVFSAQFSF